jgi:sugar lactone lactonase YvrE
MNDAKCDVRGRFWGGSCQMEFEAGKGKLHRWDGGQQNKVIVEGLALPNGIGWNYENTLMYFADSMAKKFYVSDFDLSDDFVPKFRELISIDSGVPDGLAVDIDRCIWLAVWGGSQVFTSWSPLERFALAVTATNALESVRSLAKSCLCLEVHARVPERHASASGTTWSISRLASFV